MRWTDYSILVRSLYTCCGQNRRVFFAKWCLRHLTLSIFYTARAWRRLLERDFCQYDKLALFFHYRFCYGSSKDPRQRQGGERVTTSDVPYVTSANCSSKIRYQRRRSRTMAGTTGKDYIIKWLKIKSGYRNPKQNYFI